MRLFGFEISRTVKTTAVAPLSPARGGWHNLLDIIREPFAGAWQRNIDKRPQNVLTHSALYACVTLIATDIGKLRIKLVEQDEDGIWEETESAAFSPVLRKPNHYQNRIKFVEQWILSKLIHGNTYVLKEKDARGVVVGLYVLDPCRVRALVAPDGSVYYQLGDDNLAGMKSTTVPASAIIHDMMPALFHPLCGVSPITACALPAVHGLNIQNHSAKFFANKANPGGILTAPAFINQETAERAKTQFELFASSDQVGRIIVLGDGLKFENMSVNAVDSQLIEQLKWTAEQVCTAFHVPPYMIGAGSPPTYNNIEALNQQYYAQCLQGLIESFELCLDEGLGLSDKIDGRRLGTELDLDGLLRMDTASRVKAAIDGIGGGLFAPDEARKGFDLKPLPGGSSVYMQQQMWSLEQLSKRSPPKDAPAPAPAAPAPAPDAAANDNAEAAVKDMLAEIQKGFASVGR